MKRGSIVAFMLAAVLMLSAVARSDWQPVALDTVHSRIGFTASALLFDVIGRFGSYVLEIDGSPTQLSEAKIRLTIEVSSLDTDNGNRDEHLLSPSFLDAKKFPQITFTSERISQTRAGLRVTGTLALHGQKRKLTIPFKRTKGKNDAGMDMTAFKGKLVINRNDYGIGAASVAAKIGLQDQIAIDLLLVAFLR